MSKLYEIEKVFGSEVKVLEKKNGYMVIDYRCREGNGVSTIYDLFPGVQILFNDFNTPTCFRSTEKLGEIIHINYCIRGRFECEFPNHTFTYLGEGDLAICAMDYLPISSSYPLNIYYGITIFIDRKVAKENLQKLLGMFSIDLDSIYKNLQLDKSCYICRTTAKIEHIFVEMQEAKDNEEIEYFRLKVMELLYFFNSLSLGEKYVDKYYTSAQIKKVKHITNHMIEHCDKHFSLDKITKDHGISLTSFKTCFGQIYGDTPYAYIKKYKMNEAALMLTSKQININEVAILFGYKNASKFAEAFQKVMGMTPREYRKKMQ